MKQKKEQDKFLLRFEEEGHRDRLKVQSIKAKRSLNKHVLYLVEIGERIEQKEKAA